MNKKIKIEDGNTVLFKGKILAMPVKQDAIIKKSVDLFDDDDPCIIHTSFVIKHYAEKLLSLLEHEDTVFGKDHIDTLSFLDVSSLDNVTIKLI